MRKLIALLFTILISFVIVSCQNNDTDPTDPTVVPTEPTETDPTVVPTEPTDPVVADSAYAMLIEAEDLSGMKNRMASVIREDGSLGLPTEYQGVTIIYNSRIPSIISHEGVVTLPSECWIESRDQQGLPQEDFEGLNDNWPVVVDVTMSYQGQERTAKLLFVVAPRAGYTCDKYLG